MSNSIAVGSVLSDCPSCKATNSVILRENNEGICTNCGEVFEVELSEAEVEVEQPAPPPPPPPPAQAQSEVKKSFTMPPPKPMAAPLNKATAPPQQASVAPKAPATSVAPPAAMKPPPPPPPAMKSPQAPLKAAAPVIPPAPPAPKVAAPIAPPVTVKPTVAPVVQQIKPTVKPVSSETTQVVSDDEVSPIVKQSLAWRQVVDKKCVGNPYALDTPGYRVFESLRQPLTLAECLKQCNDVGDSKHISILLIVYEVIFSCLASGLIVESGDTYCVAASLQKPRRI